MRALARGAPDVEEPAVHLEERRAAGGERAELGGVRGVRGEERGERARGEAVDVLRYEGEGGVGRDFVADGRDREEREGFVCCVGLGFECPV